MKFKKSIIVAFSMVLLLVLSSCNSSKAKKLDKAMEALDESSYTAVLEMDMVMKVLGEEQKISTVSNIKSAAKGSQVYMTASAEGTTTETYTEIKDNVVYTYMKMNDSWSKMDEVSLDEYTSETGMINIETKDAFKFKDGVFVGDCEKIQGQLSQYIDKIVEESGVDMSLELKSYEIVMEGNDISEIRILMDGSASMSGFTMEYSMNMTMKISNIGSTEVTRPAGLPE